MHCFHAPPEADCGLPPAARIRENNSAQILSSLNQLQAKKSAAWARISRGYFSGGFREYLRVIPRVNRI
jgi:hypothetical protein